MRQFIPSHNQQPMRRRLSLEQLGLRLPFNACPLEPAAPDLAHEMVYKEAGQADIIRHRFTAPVATQDDNGETMLFLRVDTYNPVLDDAMLKSTGTVDVDLLGLRGDDYRNNYYRNGETVTLQFDMRGLSDVLSRYKPLNAFVGNEVLWSIVNITATYRDRRDGIVVTDCTRTYRHTIYRYISAADPGSNNLPFGIVGSGVTIAMPLSGIVHFAMEPVSVPWFEVRNGGEFVTFTGQPEYIGNPRFKDHAAVINVYHRDLADNRIKVGSLNATATTVFPRNWAYDDLALEAWLKSTYPKVQLTDVKEQTNALLSSLHGHEVSLSDDPAILVEPMYFVKSNGTCETGTTSLWHEGELQDLATYSLSYVNDNPIRVAWKASHLLRALHSHTQNARVASYVRANMNDCYPGFDTYPPQLQTEIIAKTIAHEVGHGQLFAGHIINPNGIGDFDLMQQGHPVDSGDSGKRIDLLDSRFFFASLSGRGFIATGSGSGSATNYESALSEIAASTGLRHNLEPTADGKSPVAATNVKNQLDVNGDSHVTPRDALAVINVINAYGLPYVRLDDPQLDGNLVDVNYDGVVTSSDALTIINHINAGLPKQITFSDPVERKSTASVPRFEQTLTQLAMDQAWGAEPHSVGTGFSGQRVRRR